MSAGHGLDRAITMVSSFATGAPFAAIALLAIGCGNQHNANLPEPDSCRLFEGMFIPWMSGVDGRLEFSIGVSPGLFGSSSNFAVGVGNHMRVRGSDLSSIVAIQSDSPSIVDVHGDLGLHGTSTCPDVGKIQALHSHATGTTELQAINANGDVLDRALVAVDEPAALSMGGDDDTYSMVEGVLEFVCAMLVSAEGTLLGGWFDTQWSLLGPDRVVYLQNLDDDWRYPGNCIVAQPLAAGTTTITVRVDEWQLEGSATLIVKASD